MCFVSYNLTKGGKVCEDIAAFFLITNHLDFVYILSFYLIMLFII